MTTPEITEAKPPPKLSLCKEAERVCKRADVELKRLVLLGEDDEARFRRRMHLHLCLIALATGLTLLSIWSIVDASFAICFTLGLNSTQELLDYAGKF